MIGILNFPDDWGCASYGHVSHDIVWSKISWRRQKQEEGPHGLNLRQSHWWSVNNPVACHYCQCEILSLIGWCKRKGGGTLGEGGVVVSHCCFSEGGKNLEACTCSPSTCSRFTWHVGLHRLSQIGQRLCCQSSQATSGVWDGGLNPIWGTGQCGSFYGALWH